MELYFAYFWEYSLIFATSNSVLNLIVSDTFDKGINANTKGVHAFEFSA